jgi:uncharacterized membrane protein YcaP (DUF421 family)
MGTGKMQGFLHIDFRSVFVPSLHLAEVVLRGTVVYLFIFVILRVLRREAGAISIADLLLVVLIADAAQNAMASEYKSITEGAVLIGTIASWDYFLDWMGYRFPWVYRLVTPAPLPLIKDGRIMRRNLRQELITEEELMSQLRQQGVQNLAEVKRCYLEGDGHFSVIAGPSKKFSSKQNKKAVT